MNYKIVRYVLAQIIRLEAVLMVFPLIVSIIYGEPIENKLIFLGTAAFMFAISFLISNRIRPKNTSLYAREGLVIVALCWFCLSFFGALPFWISKEIPSFVDAFFEITSGFTTTGTTVIANIEALSKSMLFWRSFSHFLGGMGVLVFALAILPNIGTGSMYVMKAESAGPTFGKLVSKLHITARVLYIIYGALTLVLIVILMFLGMNWFDAVIQAFGTAGTGGFSNYTDSIAHFNSAAIEGVIGIFMILFGINFSLYYLLLIGHVKDFFKSEELRVYLGLFILATIVITLNIMHLYSGFFEAFRYSFFTTASISTSTGFSNIDFEAWPLFSKGILLFFMFTGAMAGSTSGGFKISRLIICIKSAVSEVLISRQPRRIVRVRYDGKELSFNTIRGVGNYFIIYMLIVVVLTLVLSIHHENFYDNVSLVLGTFNNIGQHMGAYSPSGTGTLELSNLSKIALSIGMITGRLEIFPVLILFSRKTWKKHI